MASGKGLPYDYSLRLYKDVFGLQHLHFGLWSEEDPPNLDGFRAAQERYAERLQARIPEGVRTILDVGCGTGAMSDRLLRAGYFPEPMSPCEHQQELVTARLGPQVTFHRSRFQEFAPAKTYDLVLMSESSQYVPLDQLFVAAKRALAPGGHLLLCDYFRLSPGRFYRACHVLEPFLAEAGAQGFEIREMEDITAQAAPTLTLGNEYYERFALPLTDLAQQYFTREWPRVSWLARRLLAKRLRKLDRYVHEKMPAKLDADRFLKEVTYRTYLFQLT